MAPQLPALAPKNGISQERLQLPIDGARSGAVLSALEGAMQRSEQAMAWTLIEAAAAFTLWIGDRNFGVWSVVAQAVRYRQDVRVRLTRARATKLASGQPLHSGEDRLIQWSPCRAPSVHPCFPVPEG